MANRTSAPDRPVVKSENYLSTYANAIEIAYTDGDFQFFFMDHTTDANTNEQVIERKARIVLSPENTQRFFVLFGNLLSEWRYEKERATEEAKAREEAQKAKPG